MYEFRIGYHACSLQHTCSYLLKWKDFTRSFIWGLYDMMEFQRQFMWRILANKGNEMWLFDNKEIKYDGKLIPKDLPLNL